MKEEAIRFISEVIKPWETLNQHLAAPFSMNPAINDFITTANALTVSIKHLPEAVAKIKPEDLAKELQSYEIISDLADSLKHGELRKSERECKLSVSSMFERNEKAEVRFLRNRISIQHNTYGKIDFMECALESAIFIAEKLDIKTDWNPKIFNNSGITFDNTINNPNPDTEGQFIVFIPTLVDSLSDFDFHNKCDSVFTIGKKQKNALDIY